MDIFALMQIIMMQGNVRLIQWLKVCGLLVPVMRCTHGNCRRNMVLEERNSKDGYRWRCPYARCRSPESIRAGSFFSKSKLTLQQLIMLIYGWSIGMCLSTTATATGLSQHSVVDWYNFLRQEGPSK